MNLLSPFILFVSLFSGFVPGYFVNDLASHIHNEYLAKCIHATTSGRDTVDEDCVTTKVSQLLSQESTADLLQYLVAPTTPIIVSNNCHTVAHSIGKVNAKKYPLEQALSLCTADCRAGCVHGTIGGAVALQFGLTSAHEDVAHDTLSGIEELGKKYCAVPGGLCHGIGHLVFAATRDISKSLSVCHSIAGELYVNCYGGVYMEAAGSTSSLFGTQPTSQSDFINPAIPCNTAPLDAKEACFTYWPSYQEYFFERANIAPLTRFTILKGVCEAEPNATRESCFRALGAFEDRSAKWFGIDSIHLCTDLGTADDIKSCFRGVHERFVENKDPIGFSMYCGVLPSKFKTLLQCPKGVL